MISAKTLCSYHHIENQFNTYSNFLQEMTIFGKNLHAGSFVATITNHEFTSGSNDCHFTWVPQLAFLLSSNAKVKLVSSRLIKHLKKLFVNLLKLTKQ